MSSLEPALWTGITIAIFILSGKAPVSKDRLIKSVRGGMISGAAIFKSLMGIFRGPEDLELFREYIIFWTSSLVVGFAVKSAPILLFK